MSPLRHLAHRFFGSLWPVGPSRDDSAWAETLLLPGEVGLWRLMSGADRRHAFEDQVKAMAPTELLHDRPAFGPEQRLILDEELNQLPEKYRAALVVCYLEGKTRVEAARLLGWKPGAVKIRLERASIDGRVAGIDDRQGAAPRRFVGTRMTLNPTGLQP